jgi:NADP-dependent 3-hydroxy acid dehydrogenase YdfG
VLVARRAEKLEELKADILKADSSSKVHLLPLDVMDRSAVAGLLEGLPADFKDARLSKSFGLD